MKRNVIEINEEACIGCGLCATACMQGAIEIIDGKAKLTSDSYCDGLGMCLPKCPVDAIHMVEKETDSFDESRKNIKLQKASSGGGCGGTRLSTFERAPASLQTVKTITNTSPQKSSTQEMEGIVPSQLMQWPVQLKLVSPNAPYFQNADLLIAADCTAYAYGDFHRDFIKGKVTIIGCPKLDDNQYNKEKISEILKMNSIKSITVVRMEVPCCNGIIHAVKEAMLESKCIVPYSEVVISTDGRIKL